MTDYKCSACGLSVRLETDNEQNISLIKACLCDAPIIAEMVADCYGQGGFPREQSNPIEEKKEDE